MHTKAHVGDECCKMGILRPEVKEGLPCREMVEERKNVGTDARGTHNAFAVQ